MIVTVYPGIDIEKFQSQIGICLRQRDFIFVGRLDDHKGILQVIDFFKVWSSSRVQSTLDVVGKGNYLNFLLNNRFRNVNVLGYVDNDKIIQLLEAHKFYILLPRYTYKYGLFKIGAEQFGFSFVEAMSAGCVIVATNCGAVDEIVPAWNLILDEALIDNPHYIYEQFNRYIAKMSLEEVGRKNSQFVVDNYNANIQSDKTKKAILSLFNNT